MSNHMISPSPLSIKVGNVFRMCMSDGTSFAFSDCQIVRLYEENGEEYADLLRPYVLTDGVTGAEKLTRMPIARLKNAPFWQRVER